MDDDSSPLMKEAKFNISVNEETMHLAMILFPFPYDLEERLREEALKMHPFTYFFISNKGEMALYILRTLIIEGKYKNAAWPYYALVATAIRENAKISGISIKESAWDLRSNVNPFGERN